MKQRKPVVSTGLVSIVLIFVLLCLLTFSVLSLSTAQANLKFSQKSAERTTAYYNAENTANDILLQIIGCLERHKEKKDADSFYEAVRKDLDSLSGIYFTDKNHLSYTVAMPGEQVLSVTVELFCEADADGNLYKITSWRTSSVHEWQENTPLELPSTSTFSDTITEES